MFREHTLLCNSKEEYIVNIRRMMEEPVWMSEELKITRRKFALTHSWENSVGALGDAFYFMGKKTTRLKYEL
jgi:hypothetical protein